MSAQTIVRKVIIANPQGLHMRPISRFVETVGRFQSSVLVRKDEEEKAVNGRSPIGLLGLAAEQGTELLLEIQGPDAEDALAALLNVLEMLEE